MSAGHHGNGERVGIGDHAFLSDCRTAALVAPDGGVDWMCVPRFDGPSIFSRCLDRERGGSWRWWIEDAERTESHYTGASLILRSQWETPGGQALTHDLLAVSGEDDHLYGKGFLLRTVECLSGEVVVHGVVDAAPDHARQRANWNRTREGGLSAEPGLHLHGTPEPTPHPDGTARFHAELRAGETAVLALGYAGTRAPSTVEDAHGWLETSRNSWENWAQRSGYDGIGAEHVHRGALVLRGLLHTDSGGLIAAPTTSLPEWPGGPRNWDYRYVWHRDAPLVVLALMRLGHVEDAGSYLRALLDSCRPRTERIPPARTLDSGPLPTETVLEHLDGYAGSRPVRAGNAADVQHQLDVYGHILDAALSYEQVTGDLGEEEVRELALIVGMAQRHWRAPDEGIWEVREDPRHWTISKVCAWVCFDRAVQLAELTGLEDLPVEEWRVERDAVHEEVLRLGFNEEIGAFTQSYGSRNVDGSLLRIPLLGFLDCQDTRVLGTIERISVELGEGPDLIHRYDPEATGDAEMGPEGAFLMCSFDMVSALALAGRYDEARERFDSLCRRAGPLRLFSEEMGPDGEMLGNFPQAFTHLSLIEAAMNLDATGSQDALHVWARNRRSVATEGAGRKPRQ